jgi:hypothetical protein
MNGPAGRKETAGDAPTSTGRESGSPREQTNSTKDNTGGRFVVKRRTTSSAPMVVYGRYADRRDADRDCLLLRWVGAVTHVVEELAP